MISMKREAVYLYLLSPGFALVRPTALLACMSACLASAWPASKRKEESIKSYYEARAGLLPLSLSPLSSSFLLLPFIPFLPSCLLQSISFLPFSISSLRPHPSSILVLLHSVLPAYFSSSTPFPLSSPPLSTLYFLSFQLILTENIFLSLVTLLRTKTGSANKKRTEARPKQSQNRTHATRMKERTKRRKFESAANPWHRRNAESVAVDKSISCK